MRRSHFTTLHTIRVPPLHDTSSTSPQKRFCEMTIIPSILSSVHLDLPVNMLRLTPSWRLSKREMLAASSLTGAPIAGFRYPLHTRPPPLPATQRSIDCRRLIPLLVLHHGTASSGRGTRRKRSLNHRPGFSRSSLDVGRKELTQPADDV